MLCLLFMIPFLMAMTLPLALCGGEPYHYHEPGYRYYAPVYRVDAAGRPVAAPTEVQVRK